MADEGPVSVTIAGDLAFVVIDNPPVNATSAAVRAGLERARAKVAASGAKAAILSCAGRTFVAGGDITEFDAPPAPPHLPDLLDAIEASPVPWIAAMHANALGGGFELAMACAWRIAAPGTRFALPEVNIGLIPGAGGSQRLPRLIGIEAAVEIACRGEMIDAARLMELGGLDAVAAGDLLKAARAFAARLPKRPTPVSARPTASVEAGWFAETRAALVRRAKGGRAPLDNLDAIEWAATLPFNEGQARERARHMELRDTAQSRALRHAFFAERRVARPAAISGITPRQIDHMAVVGGGLMGAGIAVAALTGGLRVTLIERDREAARAARDRVEGLLDGALDRGKITEEARAAMLARFTASDAFSDAAPAGLAVEAVFEDMDAKRAVFQNLAAAMDPGAILATNTSYLDPDEIFAEIKNPARCVGMHFFSPAHVMKLLEVVRTSATAPDVLATAFALARRLGKIGVLSGICDGFIGNRMLAAYRRAADYMLADGALPHQIDAAMRGFGMAMGPYELQDLTGLQIAWANRKRQAATREAAERYIPIADRLCAAGRLGQRAGHGWYAYAEGSRTPQRDPEVEAIITAYSAEAGLTRRAFTDIEITARLIGVLVNEGALIVDEGIAESDDDIDMVQVHGYAFPRWRGGPMHFARETGLATVASAMRAVAADSPGSWRLSKLVSDATP